MSQDIVSLSDIENDLSRIVQRELAAKDALTTALLNLSATGLKPSLLEWASQLYPFAYPILNIPVDLPTTCSDGVARTTLDFISFCLDMNITDIIASIQTKFIGIEVSYIINGNMFSIVVSKPVA